MKIPKLPILYGIFVALGLTFFPAYAIYAQSSSTNYKIEETFFGTGGEVDASSTSYRSQQSAGSLGVGNTSSTNYDAVAGFVTPSTIFLEILVTGPDVTLGVLSPSTPSYVSSQGGTCNCTFYIRSYLSSAYVVVTASQPPTSENGVSLTPKTTQGVPSGSASVEEFGINLVANTSPSSFGANPKNVRQEGAIEFEDNSFADGQAASGYQTPNQYKYVVGDIMARSSATANTQAVGKTNYTVSYMAKSKNTTSAGLYKMQHDIVVTGTF